MSIKKIVHQANIPKLYSLASLICINGILILLTLFAKVVRILVVHPLVYTLKRKKSKNPKVPTIGNEKIFHWKIRSID